MNQPAKTPLAPGKPRSAKPSKKSDHVEEQIQADTGEPSAPAHQRPETPVPEADSSDQEIDRLFALISQILDEKLGKMDDSLKTPQQKIVSSSSCHPQIPGTPYLEADQLKLIKRAIKSVVTNLIKNILKKMVEDLEARLETTDL
ncbi:uncharacterized protein LOC122295214 [Carya illinoinensis]|uniref:uncharacterized protein LOC122295214 n=1 Tax=Carya illinoinensis TaxID=32201 RepID=UPI001C724330|nr:uncharacterized protein LOC122295214 [Carya illinoinensis]